MMIWLVRRFFVLLLTLFGITVLTFLLTRLTPGDPAAMRLAGAQGTSLAAGAYEELIALNRQNLGLDKPMLLNLRFTTPEDRIHDAIGQALRDSSYWQVDGERRLMRYGTQAIPAILQRHGQVGTPSEPAILNVSGRPAEDVASADDQRRRLLALLPRVSSLSTTDTLSIPVGDEVNWWNRWMAEVGAARIQPTVVRESVMHYLSASESDLPAAKERLRVHGGLVMEPLMAAMRRDVQTTARVADALETVTGIAYRDDDEALIRERWESWWRRNRVDFEMPGGFESATRIISDTQFGVWIGQIVRLDFGESYSSRRPVSRMIAEALPVSLLLSVLSILFSYILSIPIGVYSALHRHTPADRVVTIILFVLYSLPSFWVAGILIMTMTGPPLALFPTRGLASPDLTLAADWSNLGTWFLDRVWHLILPVFCLTYGSLAFISRQMRSAMLETINQDYIRTAIAKGLDPKRVVWVHAVRNSLLPIITISAGILPELIAGAIIIESIFTIPGMGSLTFSAIMNRDYPVINAVLFLSAFLTLLGILLADLAYSLADPRIEYR